MKDKLGDGLPIGVIVMWSGRLATIPDGWAVCDGQNGTPDLRGRFVLGASEGGYDIGEMEGSETHSHFIPEHDHKVDYTDLYRQHGEAFVTQSQMHPFEAQQAKWSPQRKEYYAIERTVETLHHVHNFCPPDVSTSKVPEKRVDASHLPPCYTLAFIMKIK